MDVKRAADPGIEVEFATADTFHLARWGASLSRAGTAACSTPLENDQQPECAASLASVTNLYVLCSSDEGPDPGPHPIRQEELRAAFSHDKG
jgi:hypothetical protein